MVQEKIDIYVFSFIKNGNTLHKNFENYFDHNYDFYDCEKIFF